MYLEFVLVFDNDLPGMGHADIQIQVDHLVAVVSYPPRWRVDVDKE